MSLLDQETPKGGVKPLLIQPPESKVSVLCGECTLSRLCLPQACGVGEATTGSTDLHALVKQDQPLLHRKSTLFQQGDHFNSLFVVRAGSIKTCTLNEYGEEHVNGLYLPGDLVGLDGLTSGTHTATAVSLETTSVCTLPFDRLQQAALQLPGIQQFLFRTMAREIEHDQHMMFLLSQKNAEQRLAALFLTIAGHLRNRRLKGDTFQLSMSRNDMSNYLGVAVETLCRTLTRFQKQKLIKLEGRYVALLDPDGLEALCSHGQPQTKFRSA
jgi:CRP/FNR family transcriptional regulator